MCMIDDADGSWTHLSMREGKARKPWTCVNCRRTIEVGERYRRTTGIDGESLTPVLLTLRECMQCIAAGQWLSQTCGGWVMGALEEDLREHWDEEPQYRCFALGRLLVGLKWRWRGISADVVAAWESRASEHARTVEMLAAQREGRLYAEVVDARIGPDPG